MWRIKFNRGRARLLEPGDLCVVHGGSWLDVAEDGSRWSTEYRLLDPRSKLTDEPLSDPHARLAELRLSNSGVPYALPNGARPFERGFVQ